MKLVAWNVNGVRARLDALLGWIDAERPDVLLLQETKVTDDKFPAEPFVSRGYHLSLWGSAPLNGVAILSRPEPQDVVRGLPGEEGDTHARWIEATVGPYRVASLYLPNGTSVGSDSFAYKLRFFDRIGARMTALAADGTPVAVGGDWNVAPEACDVHDQRSWDGEICYHHAERAAWRRVVNRGFYDAYRWLNPAGEDYSWWHYQARAFELGHGLRIDHFLLSPQAMDRASACRIDPAPRAAKVASDHAPLILELEG